MFQKANESTLPSKTGINEFFASRTSKLKGLDRVKNAIEYQAIVVENAKIVRNKILKHLMVRRTRQEILAGYPTDVTEQGLNFPEVTDPQAIYYQLNANEDRFFTDADSS